jgi:hypothetical protein
MNLHDVRVTLACVTVMGTLLGWYLNEFWQLWKLIRENDREQE